MKKIKLSIIGSVGIPACYGGFETLVENLVDKQDLLLEGSEITVYCSSTNYGVKLSKYKNATLKYIPFKANGIQSIPYDVLSMLTAIRHGTNVLLVLGVSGALFFPVLRLLTNVVIITNIDGIEWKRKKWGKAQSILLRFFEFIAVKFSHVVIADNVAIAKYVYDNYKRLSVTIAYGGDRELDVQPEQMSNVANISDYALAVCRIEPENNAHIILDAFSRENKNFLVFVGNWDSSDYGRRLHKKYSSFANIILIPSVYDTAKLNYLRMHATVYIHGHSAGGTNPSLVEAMHFSLPVFAYDCDFNRMTTLGCAFYFSTVDELLFLLSNIDACKKRLCGQHMLEIARKHYTWDFIALEYFKLIEKAFTDLK